MPTFDGAAADQFLREWVRPRAGEIDQNVGTLKRALKEMGDRGLLGLRIPEEWGGAGLPTLEFRRFQEASAQASGALAFLESQHQSACGLMTRSGNQALREKFLPLLARGEATSGIAFSHLRRAGPPLIRATPEVGGFSVSGLLPWITGWGLFTHCVTAATLPDDRILFALHKLEDSSELKASPTLALAAMEVTQTITAEARGLKIPEGDVLDIQSADWIKENDRFAVVLQSPLILGCARAAVDVLEEESARKSHPGMAAAARRLGEELGQVREEAYRAMDERTDFERSLRARSAAIELAVRAAHAAVIASAGAGNLMSHSAQRVYREALAFSVLALTPPLQEATLDRLSRA
jgi:alkylation response protein AidB-like acyl-CoA dehydrogenase